MHIKNITEVGKNKNLPVPPNWLLASVIVLFFPLATGGANIYERRWTP